MSETQPLRQAVIDALRTVYDPEIPVNIWELGLIYEVSVSPQGEARVKMTLTAPNCPVAGSLPAEVQNKVKAVPGITDAQIELVFDPPWDRTRMSDAAKLALGFDLGFDTVSLSRLR